MRYHNHHHCPSQNDVQTSRLCAIHFMSNVFYIHLSETSISFRQILYPQVDIQN